VHNEENKEKPGSSMWDSNQVIASSTPVLDVFIAAFWQWIWLKPIETSCETMPSSAKGVSESSSTGTVQNRKQIPI
jgi:hypothetical protein